MSELESCEHCREVAATPKARRVWCMNTKPGESTVCTRLAGHDGEHMHCSFAEHPSHEWPKKEGDWSGSNL